MTAIVDAGTHPDFRFTQPSALAALSAPGVRRILFFLPGFNTTFAQGAAAAQRIASVADASTAVVYTDWGSQGKAFAYRRDGRSAARNAAAFGHLLQYVQSRLPQAAIDVFAHSMGSRVVIRGLAGAAKEGKPVRVSHVVLAAPDLAVADYVASMLQVAQIQRGTIYVSRRDRALLLSAIIHFHHRLGQVAVERLDLPRTDIVDVSTEDRSRDGHGYAIHDPVLLRDIYRVITGAPVPHPDWCKSNRYGAVWIFTARGCVPAPRRRG